MTTLLDVAANSAGWEAGTANKAGLMTPEEAGDIWLAYADRSHEAGCAFLASYVAAGGDR
jgi:hypothetical protein